MYDSVLGAFRIAAYEIDCKETGFGGGGREDQRE